MKLTWQLKSPVPEGASWCIAKYIIIQESRAGNATSLARFETSSRRPLRAADLDAMSMRPRNFGAEKAPPILVHANASRMLSAAALFGGNNRGMNQQARLNIRH